MWDQQFLDECKEYFEISIGYRRPSDLEKSEASKRWLSIIFSNKHPQPIDLVKMMKYPISFDSKNQLLYNSLLPDSENPKLDLLLIELNIYTILSDETNIVDGPFLPVLRYEIRIQKELLQNNEFHYAVLRQHALLETIFRMKAGLGHVKWKWTLKSVYQGEQLINKRTYDELIDFNTIRNRLAHNWFSYIEISDDVVRRTAQKGLRIMSDLLARELYEAFDSYCSKHPSQRLVTKLEQRDTASISSSANATVTRSHECDNCGHEFDPQNHHKRCPECYSWHGYWEE